MADIIQAVNWLEEGKKVRCKSWVLPKYIVLVKTEYNDFPCKLITDEGEDKLLYSFTIKANDWEIYEDDKDWNLAKQPLGFREPNCYMEEDVKKCRDLIIEDISCAKNLSEALLCVKKRFGEL